ncbi:MAG: ABC transporter permease [Desulfobacterium sp.]|nr:ABC transporter permease [Desulfobacterium sp.]
MKTLHIAFRNIFRNSRRSLMTILAIAVSSIAVHLFGGYVANIIYGMQTNYVCDNGHLQIYQEGFFDYGAGNPVAYGISRYQDLIKLITLDPQLKDHVVIATPILKFYGIAGNFKKDASKTFFGIGYVPSDLKKMRKWNDYEMPIRKSRLNRIMLSDDDIDAGIIGEGMARMLLLCEELNVKNCKGKPQEKIIDKSAAKEDFSFLEESNGLNDLPASIDKRPRLDLLAATAGGAPNIVTMYVNNTEVQGVKALDDNYAAMHISLAQRLLYGKGEKKATGIVIQLRHTKDIPFVKARLEQLFDENKLDLEFKDYTLIVPMYRQVISFLFALFSFIATIMGVIVLFTIINTMTMSVMERVDEIGTIRALGLRRSGILHQFIAEGLVLGILGATLGTVVSVITAAGINSSGIMWTPPNYVDPVPLKIMLFLNPILAPGCWLGLVMLAVASSIFPARKAGKMVIVDALRHV